MTGGYEWRHAREACAEDLGGGFEKSQLSRVLAFEDDGWLSELAEALQRVVHVVVGGSGQMEKSS